MNYKVNELNQQKYIECAVEAPPIANQKDALEWVSICSENEVCRLMLHAENLTEDFFKLRTGVAGDILQKLVTYEIKIAAILTPELVNQGRFRDMVLEANRGSHFRVFYNHQDAETWLTRF